jgi:hypothetical protein
MLPHKRNRILAVAVLICIASIIVALRIYAGKPKPEKLQFQTIEQAEYGSLSSLYEACGPELIVITWAKEIENLDRIFNEDAKTKLKTIDYSKYFVILVFQGRRPTLGYRVNIIKITRLQNDITILVDFTEPRPDMEAAPMESSPYQLIQMEKYGIWNQGITFKLAVNQGIVISTSYTMCR